MVIKILKASLMVFLYLFLALAAGELYARIKHGKVLSFQSTELAYRTADFDIHHALVPGAEGFSVTREWKVPYFVNSLGLRDREYSEEKIPGSFRILMMGDSFVEGYGVNIEDTFVKILENMLANEYSDKKFEVINCGIASYSPLLEYLFLVNKGLRLRADMVILFYDFGDLKDDYEYERTTFFNEEGLPLKSLPYKRIRAHGNNFFERFLIRHSRYYLYVENRINSKIFKKKVSKKFKDFPEKPGVERYIAFREGRGDTIQDLWAKNEKYLDMIYRLLAENGIDLVIVSYPYPIQVNGQEWAEGRVLDGFEEGVVYEEPIVVKYLEDFSKVRNIPFLNLCDRFKESEDYPLYYSFDGHFTEKGHKLVANGLFEYLLQEDLFAKKTDL